MTTLYAPKRNFVALLPRRAARIAGSCALGVAFAVAAMGSVSRPALAAKKSGSQQQASAMTCELWAVHASKKKGSKRIPAELSALRPELSDDQFAAYSSFYLLEKKSLKVQAKRAKTQSFRSGYQLSLNLLQSSGTRLLVQAKLNRGAGASLVNLDYWMNSGGLLMLVGGNYKDGKIVFATRCRAAS